MQIMRAAGSIARRSRFEAWLLAILLIGCTKEESLRPSRAHSSATLMASELGRSKDFFFQVPSAVDGSFTRGENACFEENAKRRVHFLLGTDGGLRTCSGEFLPGLQPWAARNDVVAVICSGDEQVLVVGDGTVWGRVDPRFPFRATWDCSPVWNNREARCRDLSESGDVLNAPVDICERALSDSTDGG